MSFAEDFDGAGVSAHVANNAVLPLVEKLAKINGLWNEELVYSAVLALVTQLVQEFEIDPSELAIEVSRVAHAAAGPHLTVLLLN